MLDQRTIRFKLLEAFLRIFVHVLPLNYATIPGCYANAEPEDGKSRPLIVFSHGLTGTGEENATLLASWAREGCVVVSCQHMDGSSARVPLANGDSLWFKKSNMKAYDPNFRPKQVHLRVQEVNQVVAFA